VEKNNGAVVELVVTAHLKCAAERRAGSTPASPTKNCKYQRVLAPNIRRTNMANMNQKERSIKNGEKIEVAGTLYIGRTPKYRMIDGIMVKVAKGVPFVKP
jgi:hypothetical protein